MCCVCVFVEKIHLIDIYLLVIWWMINLNQQCLMWNFYVIFANRLLNEICVCKSFLSFFHPSRLVGHFISFLWAIVLFFKLLVTNESLQEKKKTICRILSFLLHVFVNIEQKLTEEINLFAFKVVRFCFIHMVYS
jgi:hypothetical protein